MSTAVVEVEGLETRFGKTVVHEDVNLTAFQGEILAIIGTSGGGKTTLLREITGLRKPTAGRVRVLGSDIHNLHWREARALRKRWGMLFQQGALFSAFTVYDNVAFPLRELRTLGEQVDEAMVHDLVMLKLEMIGMHPEDANKRPAELSGGMIKRVALARALAVEAELLFLDEPTSGLDPLTAQELDRLLKDLHSELGLSIVMVSHDLESVAALADRVVVLAERRILYEGSVANLTSSEASKHPAVSRLLEGSRAASLRARK